MSPRHPRLRPAALIVVGLAAAAYARQPKPGTAHPPAATEGGVSVWFSPRGGCEAEVVAEVAAAKASVDVRAYSFTSYAIGQALADAAGRGVKVRAILDAKAAREEHREPDLVAAHGVATYTDDQHPIAHDKVMVIDGLTIVTGSFNFTQQAEQSNAENLVVIRDRPAVAAAYAEDFERHLKHSKAYEVARP